ncbi:MAG: sigma 54-interacting transcriptional regulator [Deltaproteobacteria bacterium]|nr:sigma 54-interacting transcriptional regulator [Deltaproteobacteria bacterium]
MQSTSSSSFFVGEHLLMQKINAMVRRVATTDATVLITGESGTGKELVARAVHTYSPRASCPFVAVNCAAIPEELLESELFGHVRGAFTGALAARVGMFQLADGGSLFLDEIGEMSVSLQVKLLRVLQDREVRRVGADQPVSVNVRVIAATNKDLAAEVEKGAFREDLFYRLQVIPIHLPPLRARRSDIPLLVQHFLGKLNLKYGRTIELAPETMVYLWEYDWPGNVRELENLVERVIVLSDDDVVVPDELPSYVRSFISEKKLPNPTLSNGELDLQQAVEQFENRLIDEALRHANSNITAAARILKVNRTTLIAKLRRRRSAATLLPREDSGDPQAG